MTAAAAGDDPAALAADAAEVIADRTGIDRHDVALVLGSGWAPAAELLGTTVAEISAPEIPGFRASAVPGHASTIRSVMIDRAGAPGHALVLGARTHLYEGHGVRAVVHGVRAAAAAGCHTVVLTNGAGSLNPGWRPGTAVLISDHLNLTGASPLEGATFIDLTDLYSARLRALCRTVDPLLPEGIYSQLRGPQYETPAEIRMLSALGGDLVGMSTALEAIAAREAGLEVLGITLVTNLAAGISGDPLSHSDVIAAGRAAATRLGTMLAEVVRRLEPVG